jgi:hypothetical protein
MATHEDRAKLQALLEAQSQTLNSLRQQHAQLLAVASLIEDDIRTARAQIATLKQALDAWHEEIESGPSTLYVVPDDPPEGPGPPGSDGLDAGDPPLRSQPARSPNAEE